LGTKGNERDEKRGRREPYSQIPGHAVSARWSEGLDITWRLATTDLERDSSPQELIKGILSDLEEAIREFAGAEKAIQL
jgi:hypothetical protein